MKIELKPLASPEPKLAAQDLPLRTVVRTPVGDHAVVIDVGGRRRFVWLNESLSLSELQAFNGEVVGTLEVTA